MRPEPSIYEEVQLVNLEKALFVPHCDNESNLDMVIIGRDVKHNFSVLVADVRGWNQNIPYFNVYNHADYSCATEVARLHFRDCGIETCNNRGLPPWIMDSTEIKNLVEFMNRPNRFVSDYTNWQLACYKWNCVNYIFKTNEWFRDYMDGKLDVKYSSNKAYIPSTQKMPETWEFR